MSTTPKPTHIAHVSIVVADLAKATQEWCDRLGLQVIEEFQIPSEGVDSVFLSPGHGRDEGVCVELMAPLDPTDEDNVLVRRLEKLGEGFHVIGFRVDDPIGQGAKIREQGADVIELPSVVEGDPGRAFVHPKSFNGVLVELF
jgi:methylmalonyl-CoA epimerase